MNLVTQSVSDIALLVRSKQVKATEVAEFFLGRAEKLNGELGAFITFNRQLMEQAQEIDRRVERGLDPGVLAGVPVAIKDSICTQNLTTTAGSRMLKNFCPPYSATLVDRLEKSGALILGKTNLDEFAMGSSSETSAFGVCRNPWNREYVPGGSSGGSAVAVAARMSALAIGTDTGGSIRQPASFCGVVGMKPTYGRVSRFGMIAYGSSLDQAGPLARRVQDVALALEVMAGPDCQDSTCANNPVPHYSQEINFDLKGLRVGFPRQFFQDGLDEDIVAALDNVKSELKDRGVQIVEIDLPLAEVAVATYYLVATSEASSNLSRYDGVRYGHRADFSRTQAKDLEEFYSLSRGEGFGEEVKRRIILGTYALSSGYYDAYYKKAAQVRRLIRDEYMEAFKKCEVIFAPVTATPPFKIGEKISDPLAMYLNDQYTTSANLAGIPAVSVPAGVTKQNLPIGVQFLAPHFEEQRLFNIAGAVEEAVAFERSYPNAII